MAQMDDRTVFQIRKKKVFGCGFCFFVSDVTCEVIFLAILAVVTWPRAQPLDQSGSLKYLLEGRPESVFFEFLIDFL